MSEILIVEDEDVIRSALRRLLERHGYAVQEAACVQDVLGRGALDGLDLIIADLRLPDGAGTDLIARAGSVPVLIMTSYASVRSAVDSMKRGAVDYIAKPFDHDEMLLSVQRILKQSALVQENALLRQELSQSYPVTGMIGQCALMRDVFDRLAKVAPTDTTVLILGESGTGKELVARALHAASRRGDGPFIAVNCASVPEGLIESELFGHEKGAFTGAVGMRKGLVEAANGGTLFLDEIGELPLAAQARLLRVLQEGEIRRVGADHARHVDVRLLAATHRNLRQRVEAGQFRSDLFFRLRVMEICLPPLRERGEDIQALANFLLQKSCQRLNRANLCFTSEAMTAIRAHRWPGNIRELENAIERAVILCDGTDITPKLLALENTEPMFADGQGERPSGALSLDGYFVHFVREHEHNMTETELAKRLGISRKTLWERRIRLGIPKQRRSK